MENTFFPSLKVGGFEQCEPLYLFFHKQVCSLLSFLLRAVGAEKCWHPNARSCVGSLELEEWRLLSLHLLHAYCLGSKLLTHTEFFIRQPCQRGGWRRVEIFLLLLMYPGDARPGREGIWGGEPAPSWQKPWSLSSQTPSAFQALCGRACHHPEAAGTGPMPPTRPNPKQSGFNYRQHWVGKDCAEQAWLLPTSLPFLAFRGI